MVLNERDIRHELVVEAGRRMMMAARTAPKARGVDIIEIALVSERADLEKLSAIMRRKGEESGMQFLLRDAENILQGDAVLLIGTPVLNQGLNCAYCGCEKCADKPLMAPCVMNSVDLGIAVGSACSLAATLCVDTRVMFSAGWSSLSLDWLPGCTQVISIALSCTSKNPFFDRQPRVEAKYEENEAK